LIKEYNRVTEKLIINANKIAKFEIDSAWRDMAKQIAHDIKNPLTPLIKYTIFVEVKSENVSGWQINSKFYQKI
jgi:hypothetical protein